nr:hypothetical protein [Desulfobacula sp.]
MNLAWVQNPKKESILLALADNRMKRGSSEEASKFIQLLIQVPGLKQFENVLNEVSKEPMGVHFDIPGLSLLISTQLQELANSYKKVCP